jgi:glycine cleavage system protein P-like pyridoxal-binding family
MDRFAYPLEGENVMLVAATEKRTAEDVDRLIDVLRQV